MLTARVAVGEGAAMTAAAVTAAHFGATGGVAALAEDHDSNIAVEAAESEFLGSLDRSVE